MSSAALYGRFRGGSKYGAKPVVADGVRFDSAAERERWEQLKILQRAGRISGLERQIAFPFRINRELMFTYYADFRYLDAETGRTVVEDVKGVATPVYKIKKKIIEASYRIEIVEIRKGNARRVARRRKTP